ncbi:hypothetical protein BUALT_Bualt08G0009500 [Buddleja alternifolia]|uniref:Uncharacterized protein n=1 Tax=Buddleja alternifolia TaxID=168488 RepID=A0AAV6XDP0_9LAMI|nr:hypothetical protein BUALT_Bualt08G0009500 [Buddleja alternifolia]
MVDLSMVQLVEKYDDIDPGIPIRIWIEEIYIDFNDTCESISTQEFTKVGEDDAIPEVNDPVHEVDDAEPKVNTAKVNDAEPAVNDPVDEGDNAETEANAVPKVNVVNNEEEVPASPIQYGDYFAESEDSRSDFDDFSDADYIQEKECEECEEGERADGNDDRADDEFSDTPSFLLEDIKGSNDDDIFTEKKIQASRACTRD